MTDRFSYLGGSHAGLIDDMYRQYLRDPSSLEESWKKFFEGFEFARANYAEAAPAAPAQYTNGQGAGAVPESIQKEISQSLVAGFTPNKKKGVEEIALPPVSEIPAEEIPVLIHELEQQMELAAKNLEFEKAAALKDKLSELKKVKLKRKR